MKSLWLWFLRELHKLSMKIALWAKSQTDSFDLPAPEQRQAGQPPADWLARVQQASQPPAHWLEYIQSKTGQMPQMQDMSTIVQESSAAPKANLPIVQEKQAPRPVVRDERPINWRQSPRKIVTEIDELPVPQSKEAAIISYQSPMTNRVPERLHWRIQKPAGKSVFDAAELQKSRETEAKYPDFQEASAKPVNYAQAAKPQSKKLRYRLLKRGMRGKVAYQAQNNLTPSAAQSDSTPPPSPSWRGETSIKDNTPDYSAPKTAQNGETSYQAPEASPGVETAYKAQETSSKAESQFRAPEHSQKADAQYSQMSALPKAETEYKSPENTGETAAEYTLPKQTENSETTYPETYRERRDSSVSYIKPLDTGTTEANYQEMKSPIVPDAEYAKPKQSLTPSAAQSDSTPSPSPSWRGETRKVDEEAVYRSPQSSASAQGNYAEAKAGTSDSVNYSQAEQSQNSQSRFVTGGMPSDAKTVLAGASSDYWIALPNELNSEEMSAKNHQNRLDAEQRGEF